MRCCRADLAMQLPCQELSPKQPALAKEKPTHANWRCFQAASLQMVKMLGHVAVYSLCQILRMQSMADWCWMALADPSCSGARTLATHVSLLIHLHGKGNVCVQSPANRNSSVKSAKRSFQSATSCVSNKPFQNCRSCLAGMPQTTLFARHYTMMTSRGSSHQDNEHTSDMYSFLTRNGFASCAPVAQCCL